MGKDQTPVPLVKDYEKLKGKLEQRKPGLSGLQGKAVRIHMRNGSEIEGTITSVEVYELEVITSERRRYIIMKHAIDVIETI